MSVASKVLKVGLTVSVMLGLVGCSNVEKIDSSNKNISASSSVKVSSSPSPVSVSPPIDLTAIPLGDGKTTTSMPTEKGYLYVCKIITGGGGAFSSPWVGDTTWNSTAKVKVDGENYFTNAVNSFANSGEMRTVSTNGLPDGSPAGNFPVATTDDAYNYDRNPNTVTEQSVNVSFPLNPVFASSPSCTNMSAIGYALNGVAIFNAVDGENRDAVAHEVQDECDGHPEISGTYHYHNGSACLVDKVGAGESVLIGYALDGFGIYVEKDANDFLKTNADLDLCHGTVSNVLWNGFMQDIYHYSVTLEFPYTVGCFMGSPVEVPGQVVPTGPSGGQNTGQGPMQGPGQGPGQGSPPSGMLPPKP